jgi:hypothetical protein
MVGRTAQAGVADNQYAFLHQYGQLFKPADCQDEGPGDTNICGEHRKPETFVETFGS